MTTTPVVPLHAIRWSSTGIGRIVQFAAAHAGLTFPENRREITEAAVRRAMTHAGFKNADAFADHVVSDPAALDTALAELTIGETYFFRDPAQWDLVRREIVPELLAHHPGGLGIRAWSAGCASGEEAYTLGIVLRDAGCIAPTIVGTDLSEHRLARAARAVYSKWSMRGLDAAAQRRYFRQNGQHFHLLPELRDVRFRALNLIEDAYGEPGQELSELDVILCRNVLIYIETEQIALIFARLVGALRVGGWLMIAASDPQPSSDLPLDVVVTDAGLLFRKRGAHTVRRPERSDVCHEQSEGSAFVQNAVVEKKVVVAESSSELATRAYRLSDYDRAAALAQAVVDSGRDDAGTWVLLVRAHANRGAIDAAAQSCALGAARFPEAAELYVIESAIESQRERFGAAAQAARRAVYLDRTLAVAQLALGTALLRVGDNTAADRALRAAERLLAERSPMDVVPASDGASVRDLLTATRAHRALLDERTSRVG
ncbi:MAG: putative chemotaxis protein methyltransferase [Gemmatimonadetes bacterium]|nr:putative chemotaxis protein methyltransferase [Gemmatimonadota bacterium]